MNVKEKMQKNENGNLQRNQTKKIMDLSSWPIFNLKPDYISQDEITMAYCWERTAIIVTKDKNVYSFGIASGINDAFSTRYSTKIEDLCGKNIKTFAKSSDFVLALTEEGEVYESEIEEEFPAEIELKFIRINVLSEKGIVDVACGNDRFLALARNGEIYGYLSYRCNREIRQVRFKSRNSNIVQIACGETFYVALTDEGKLYDWRQNWSNKKREDSTGHKCDSPSEFTRISDRIVKAACGDQHTLVLTDKGKVYAWGNNDRGQIGVGSNDKLDKFFSPVMVNVPELVVDIAAWHQSSVAVDVNGVIYVWGEFHDESITTPFPTILWRIHDAFAQNRFYSAMHKPLTVSNTNDCVYVKEKLIILESLGAAFDDPSTSDFTIQVEGQLIYVHKGILKIRCQYFRNLFQRDLIKNNQNTGSSAVYTVPDEYSYIVYKAFLKYVYTGSLDVPSENALELMKLAHEFDETSLKRDCIPILKRAITSSNAAFLYSKAIEYDTEELEEFCFQFVLRHLKAIVLSEDYRKLDMNTKDRLIRRAAEEDVFET